MNHNKNTWNELTIFFHICPICKELNQIFKKSCPLRQIETTKFEQINNKNKNSFIHNFLNGKSKSKINNGLKLESSMTVRFQGNNENLFSLDELRYIATLIQKEKLNLIESTELVDILMENTFVKLNHIGKKTIRFNKLLQTNVYKLQKKSKNPGAHLNSSIKASVQNHNLHDKIINSKLKIKNMKDTLLSDCHKYDIEIAKLFKMLKALKDIKRSDKKNNDANFDNTRLIKLLIPNLVRKIIMLQININDQIAKLTKLIDNITLIKLVSVNDKYRKLKNNYKELTKCHDKKRRLV